MSSDSEITRICPSCGRVLQEEWKSCPHCGKNLNQSSNLTINRSLSTLSIILGVISLIVAGIPLGIGAIICGAIAVSRDNDQRGILGVVLGLLGALMAFMLLVYLF